MADDGMVGGRFGGWIAMALIYAVLNGALWIGQEVSSRDEAREAERIEAELATLEHEIEQVAVWLESKAQLSDAIDALGVRLDEGGAHYASSGRYEEDLRRFNRQVDQWNAGMAALEAEAARHDRLIDQYDQLIDRYNTAAEAAYSRWWLLPIPAPRRAVSAASR